MSASEPAISARDALREFIACARQSDEAFDYVIDFMLSDSVLADFRVDHARTAEIGTDELIYFDKPSDALLNALAKVREMNAAA